MRNVCRYYQSALPFVGTFTKNINFANEGNFNPKSLNRASVKGVVLTNLMELKIGFNFKLNLLQTDVRLFLQQYVSNRCAPLSAAVRLAQGGIFGVCIPQVFTKS